MRKIVLCVVAVAIVLPFAFGCGGGTESGQNVVAEQFDDGAEKYVPVQQKCPVCGGSPIKQAFHAELDGKRVYFDKEECVKEFKKNPSTYKDKLRAQFRDYIGG